MTPDEMKTIAIELYESKNWRQHLADDLSVDIRTIFRWQNMDEIPVSRAVHINQLRVQKRVQDRIKKRKSEETDLT